MGEFGRVPRLVPAKASEGDRLESWKEIAAYLGRDIRTIARWEKHEGLPVHRQQHGKAASVYAFKRELDDWRSKRALENRSRARWRAAAAALAVLVIAAVLFTAGRLTHSRQPQTTDAKPLTGHPGTELQPALAPDGQHVAYVWNGETEDNFDIYVRLIAAGRPLRLTSDPAQDYSPAWSPDGASVAFLRRTGPARSALIVISALGGAERRVAEVSGGAGWDWSRPGPFLTWAPDGRSLVITAWKEPENVDQLRQIILTTGEIRSVTPLPPRIMGDSAPAFSPDGKMLAFSRRISWGVSELCLLDVSKQIAPAGELRRLNTGSTWNSSPAWMPDGRSLVFSSGTMDSTHLAKIDVSGSGAAERLAGGVGAYGWHPRIARAPDGQTRLVYTRHFESVNIWRCTPGHQSPARHLISSAHWSYEPAYAPDGKRVAFISDRTGFGEIWVADADGRDVTQWTFMKQPRLGSPRWSPDSRRIAFTAPGDQGSSIYLIDAPGAAPRLVRGSERSGYLAWSPDGRAIYYSSDRSGSAQIWKIPTGGGNPTQVTTGGGRVPGIAPGGADLFYLRVPGPGENHLYRVPLTGGEEEKVLDFVDAYSLAQTGVAFKYYRPGLNPVGPFLEFFDFATGKTERLPDAPKPLRYGVAISPDGRSLLYSQSDYEITELMLVEDFR